MTPQLGSWRRLRDTAVVALLLALPFFVLRSHVRQPRDLNALDRVVLNALKPLQYVGAVIGKGVSALFGSYVYLVDVKAENDKLGHENIALKEKVRRLEAMEAENRRLKKLLGLKDQHGPEALTAQVIAKDASDFRVTNLLLDKVSSEVKPGWAVLSEEGVVGVVLRAEGATLEVQLAVDPQLAIDVVDERTGARGLVRGTGDLTKYTCKVEYMKRADEVAVGDLLVTSGIGARFPKGVSVARITKIHNRGFGEFQEVEAEPVVSFSRLEEALVVPPAGAPKEPEPKPAPKK
ncbi:MAG: rod shape-determining protein MreC [Myxococcales bacterium]|nr:rod shape-determining protein MreC [Myxococcales bacterium]